MSKKLPLINLATRLYQKIYGPMPLIEFQDYDQYWDFRSENRPPADVLHRYVTITDRIKNGESVIDIGCGDGAFLQYFHDRNPQSRVYGVDLSQKAIDLVKQRGFEGAVTSDARPLQEQIGATFDNVVMMEVIEHVHDAEDLLRQALALEPKRIFITIPNVGFILHRLRLLFGGRFPITVIIYHVKEHIRFWTVKDFVQWAKAMQCEVADYVGQEQTSNPMHLWLMRIWPSLFAGQLVYELKPIEAPRQTAVPNECDGIHEESRIRMNDRT